MNKLKELYKENRNSLLISLFSLISIVLFNSLKHFRAFTEFFVNRVSTPVRTSLAEICSIFPFSVAEIIITVIVIYIVMLFIKSILKLLSNYNKLKTLLSLILNLSALALFIYMAFCLCWGFNYYASSFQEKSGIYAQRATKEELFTTTQYFAKKLSETTQSIPRDQNGISAFDRELILEESTSIYTKLDEIFPFLSHKTLKPKKIFFSGIMSRLNFTGFLFPFTGESNINMASPTAFLPSTVAHEIAHQRNVITENEANFVGILACLTSNNAKYTYSGSLLAYIHLSNALYAEDKELWKSIWDALPKNVKNDIVYNNEYWKPFTQKTSYKLSNRTYDKFLKNYGLKSGTKSYGEVVDLLIVYFKKS